MSYKLLFALNKNKVFHQITRVDLAGERAAIKIYSGQIKALHQTKRNTRAADDSQDELSTLTAMLDSEFEHLTLFEQHAKTHQVRPTLMLPLWDILSFWLGFITSAASTNYAMACTQGIETAISQHYHHQLKALTAFINHQPHLSHPDSLKLHHIATELHTKITKFKADEEHHTHTALDNTRNANPHLHNFTVNSINLITRIAIEISEKI